MLRINNIKVPIKASLEDYPKYIASYLNIRKNQIKDVKLLKRAIDARKQDVHYVCNFAFSTIDEKRILQKHPSLTTYTSYSYPIPNPTKDHTIVVGSGPAGLFCAWLLAKSHSSVTLIERGKAIPDRIKDVESMTKQGSLNPTSNIQFGEGGAGTFSDGKLTTGIKDPRVQIVLETFVHYGAPDDILYEAMPHIGTDYLRQVIQIMRQDLIKMGVEVRFETQMTDLITEDNTVKGIIVNNQEKIYADHVVLAIGHSARDTFEMLYQNQIIMYSKPFAVGLRIEHLQEDVNQTQYKNMAPYLKAAPYKAAYHAKNGRGVYTFCMCPGGNVVAAASEENTVVTNGMSTYARDQKNANSAILVSVNQQDFGSEHPLAGMYFQRQLEKKAFQLGGGNYFAPCSLVKDYLNNTTATTLGKIKPSYQPGITFTNLNELFSDEINEALKEGIVAFSHKLPFFKDEEAILTGVESRSSSPVRFERDENFMSSLKNLYPCGEGAGQAGGIVSAAVDGLKVAEAILKNGKR